MVAREPLPPADASAPGAAVRAPRRRPSRIVRLTFAVLLGSLALAALGVLALGALRVPLSGGPWRDDLERVATRVLGREVKLDGDLVLVPGLEPKLSIGGLRIANPPGFGTPDFATLAGASLQLALAPLLEGRLHVIALEARDARVRLEVDANGRANWGFDPTGTAQASPGAAGQDRATPRGVAIAVERLAIADIVVWHHDARTGITRELDLDALEGEASRDRPLALRFNGHIEREFAYAGTVQAAPLAELAAATGWPFVLDVKLIGSSIHLDGRFHAATGRTEATLGLGAKDLGEIERFLQTKLPPVGATGFAATLAWGDGKLRLDDIRAVMGASSLDGRIEVSLAGERPLVTGLLSIPQLDVRPFLGSSVSPDAPADPMTYAELERVTLDLRQLAAFDVDVGLRLGRVLGLPGDVRDARLSVDLHDGVLDAPLAATVAEVTLTGRLTADARQALPSVWLELGARDTRLGGLAELLAGLRGLQGTLGRFDLRLGGRGETVGNLVRAMEVKVAAGDARLTYGNAQGERPVRMTLAELVAAVPPGERLRAEARGTLLDVPVRMTLAGGDLASTLRDQRAPLDLEVRAPGATLAIKGTFAPPSAAAGADLRFALDAKRSGELAGWLGVAARSALPIAIAGHARVESDEWHVEDTTVRVGRSKLALDAHRTGIGSRKPFTLVSLRSPFLDVPELESLRPPGAARPEDRRTAIDLPLFPRDIDLADADIGIGLERVVLGRTELVNAGFAARFRDGRLPPTPFAGTLAGVPFQGTLAFDPRRETPDLTLALGADNVDVGALLARLGVAEGFNARADALRLELIGRGERLSELARRSSFRATLAGGTLDLRNPGGKPLAQIAISEVVAGAEAGEPVRVAIDGRIGKTPVKIGVASGTLAAFLENREYVPFKVDAEAAGTRMNVNGRMALPLAAGRGDLTLVLSGDRLDSLDTLAQTELPPWGPWSLSGPVRATRDAYEVAALDVRVGESLLEGSGRLELSGARPRLDMSVKSSRLQLDDFPLGNWSAFSGAKPDAQAKLTTSEARARAKQAAASGEALLSRDTLNRFDAYLDVQVEEVRSGEDRLGSGWLRAQVDAGRLTVGPALVNLPGGTATMSAGYTPLERGVEVAVGAYVDRFDYGVLARRAQPGTTAAGQFSLRTELSATAPALDAVMAHANGRIDFAVWPERIAADAFDLWAVNVFVALLPAVDSSKSSRVNCAVGRFDLKDGKLTEDRLVLDTSRMRVNGHGRVDFDTEQIELRMQPRAKRAQFFSLQTPVDVRGTLEDFKVGVRGEDVAATVIRFFTSVIVVPFQQFRQGRAPQDGQDVCADPLR